VVLALALAAIVIAAGWLFLGRGSERRSAPSVADDTAATKLTGRDPIRSGELTHEEIEKGQKDADYQLQMHKAPDPVTRTKGPRYTPVSKRQDKPDGIAWIIKNHPESYRVNVSQNGLVLPDIVNCSGWSSGKTMLTKNASRAENTRNASAYAATAKSGRTPSS